eukprot:gb/GECG01009644.1/.p1 GENE.gb/GECG01009644.1/~~gb/GECG01009644.1/.p1  ORF type:complete len:184 (+),score=20.80 gb/GECG01009644.1/:1-552(+)
MSGRRPGAPESFDPVNAELLALTYGSMVAQIVKDYESPHEINQQIEAMGYRIGTRLVDEYCAKVRRPKCVNFVQTLETAATDGLQMFLGVSGKVSGWNSKEDQCEIFLPKNPLEEWVELPPNMADLRYSNIICGAIRGALEMVHYKISCEVSQDALKGDPQTSFQVQLHEVMKAETGEEYNDE